MAKKKTVKKKTAKKKVVKKKTPEPEKREVLDSLGDEQERPVMPEPPAPEPPDKRPETCGCGGTVKNKIKYCPECGRTWCDLCLKSNQICPICDTKGV